MAIASTPIAKAILRSIEPALLACSPAKNDKYIISANRSSIPAITRRPLTMSPSLIPAICFITITITPMARDMLRSIDPTPFASLEMLPRRAIEAYIKNIPVITFVALSISPCGIPAIAFIANAIITIEIAILTNMPPAFLMPFPVFGSSTASPRIFRAIIIPVIIVASMIIGPHISSMYIPESIFIAEAISIIAIENPSINDETLAISIVPILLIANDRSARDPEIATMATEPLATAAQSSLLSK